MSWRLDVRHETVYRYDGDVATSYNEARLTPLTTPQQLTIDARLEVSPAVRLSRYWDYWGTLVHAFDVHVRHSELAVVATAKVDTPPAVESAEADLGWAELAGPAVLDRYYEYLAPTASVPLDAELGGVVEALRAHATTPRDGVQVVTDWVRGHLAYEKGSTSVSTSAVEVWRAGRGVCQDFVHLTLALLRGLGIPARYASGYLHPNPDAAIGETVIGDSHAWAEAWTGSWHPIDPTNGVRVGERHVLVARGRDYRDVAPLKGVYTGAPPATPTVTVALTRRG